MAWETDRHGRTRYVQKLRINGRVTSKVLGTAERGLIAEQQVIERRKQSLENRRESREIEEMFDLYERIVKQVLDQCFINKDLVKRKSVWQDVDRLNNPLTNDEQTLIDQIKSISEPMPPGLLDIDDHPTIS